jgi:hypothetical protein
MIIFNTFSINKAILLNIANNLQVQRVRLAVAVYRLKAFLLS